MVHKKAYIKYCYLSLRHFITLQNRYLFLVHSKRLQIKFLPACLIPEIEPLVSKTILTSCILLFFFFSFFLFLFCSTPKDTRFQIPYNSRINMVGHHHHNNSWLWRYVTKNNMGKGVWDNVRCA